jgi:hypothetical protein
MVPTADGPNNQTPFLQEDLLATGPGVSASRRCLSKLCQAPGDLVSMQIIYFFAADNGD